MSISTKMGDGGMTSLPGGKRVRKDDPRIEYFGALDELDAHLATILAEGGLLPFTAETIGLVQNGLFSVQADSFQTDLESRIAALEESHPNPLSEGFVRAWKNPQAARLNLARTVCRRAERRALSCAAADGQPEGSSACLNRLSDLLFLLAIAENE